MLLRTDQLDNHPAFLRFVSRTMLEGVRFEITAEFAIQVPQHVEIELGGDPGAVVVGSVDDRRIFLQVGANQ